MKMHLWVLSPKMGCHFSRSKTKQCPRGTDRDALEPAAQDWGWGPPLISLWSQTASQHFVSLDSHLIWGQRGNFT